MISSISNNPIEALSAESLGFLINLIATISNLNPGTKRSWFHGSLSNFLEQPCGSKNHSFLGAYRQLGICCRCMFLDFCLYYLNWLSLASIFVISFQSNPCMILLHCLVYYAFKYLIMIYSRYAVFIFLNGFIST